ncbi:MAG: peptidylprolyl isomerase [Bacteroidales bacterium]|jgi:peptidyl-prolyl cis-trans isomerase SurA|nr:peptidylprolyl isomerase [Bacteroidales bacterium]
MNNFFKNIRFSISGTALLSSCLGFILTVLLSIPSIAQQEQVVDQVVAVVGKNIVLESDIETQYLSYRMQSGISGSASEIRCVILEDIMYQKLMAAEAEVDSIEVSDIQVESELDRRLGMFINQFGSQEKLEAYYDKTLVEIKQELYDIVKDQLVTQQVQSGIIEGITVTPSEIRSFFRSLPTDSIPLIKTEFVIAEIVKKPPVNVEEKIRVKEQLLEFRKRILKGESFSTLAILYSQDPGSAKEGGELGFYGRGQLYPEFEAIAFKLKEGEVSNVVETEAGYHIIQMIERKGDYVNVRHILLVPKVAPEDLVKARNELDSVAVQIRADSITFDQAVEKFSDADNKNSGGLLINPYTGSTTFEAEQLDAQVSFTIEKMEVGELSNPVPMKTEDQKDAYRLLLLKEKREPHRASLEQDYSKIQEWALQDKQRRIVDNWINEKARKTYIRIIDHYKDCTFANEWNPR